MVQAQSGVLEVGEGRCGRSLTLGQVLETRRPGSGPAWAGREPGRRSASQPRPRFHCLLEHGPFFVTPATYVLSTGAEGRCPQPCRSPAHTIALTRHLMPDKRQYQKAPPARGSYRTRPSPMQNEDAGPCPKGPETQAWTAGRPAESRVPQHRPQRLPGSHRHRQLLAHCTA